LPFAGEVVAEPTAVTTELIRQLQGLICQAPLHLPGAIALMENCGRVFARGGRPLPVILTAQTAFFSRLPQRETLYAVDAELAGSLGVRRYGFQGLYHEAAARQIARERRAGARPPARLASICMEPRLELAAVAGTRPIMVTGGSTPLEGLMGQRQCGRIDPSIVLNLADKHDWGPEQINRMLTRDSGLKGLVDRAITWPELFADPADEALEPVRQMVRYELLQACGSAMAVLGGLDVVAFTGRYASVGETLGPWLCPRLRFKQAEGPIYRSFDDSPERLVYELTVAAALRLRAA
jgi:acetate kinase